MPTTVAIAASASGDNTVVAAVTNKKIRVLAFLVSFGGTVNAKWKSGASADKTGLLYGVLGAQAPGRPPPPAPSQAGPPFLFDTAKGEALVLNLSGATAVGGWVTYDEVLESQ